MRGRRRERRILRSSLAESDFMPEEHRTPLDDDAPDRLDASIVIPTRNRWPLLSTAALPGALAQEDVSFEVIVVDDGSTDETPERLEELAARDPRLRVVRHERSHGVAQAR